MWVRGELLGRSDEIADRSKVRDGQMVFLNVGIGFLVLVSVRMDRLVSFGGRPEEAGLQGGTSKGAMSSDAGLALEIGLVAVGRVGSAGLLGGRGGEATEDLLAAAGLGLARSSHQGARSKLTKRR